MYQVKVKMLHRRRFRNSPIVRWGNVSWMAYV